MAAPEAGKGSGRTRAKAPSEGASNRGAELEIAKSIQEAKTQRYVLRLYVTGLTPASTRAIERARAFCEEHLHGRYELEVVDIYQLPALAKDEQIVATPTLIKVLPRPLQRYIGDLSRAEKTLFGLDLREKD